MNEAAFGFGSSIIASEFREALDRAGAGAGAVTATTVAIRAWQKKIRLEERRIKRAMHLNEDGNRFASRKTRMLWTIVMMKLKSRRHCRSLVDEEEDSPSDCSGGSMNSSRYNIGSGGGIKNNNIASR